MTPMPAATAPLNEACAKTFSSPTATWLDHQSMLSRVSKAGRGRVWPPANLGAQTWKVDMDVYKFLTKDRQPNVLRGELWFSSLEHFRYLEVALADRSIGDKFEGLAETAVDFDNRRHEDDDPIYDRLLRAGISISGNSNIIISNSTSSSIVDAFVYCVSTSKIATFGGVGAGYDACVKVADANSFAEQLLRHGTIDGTPLGEYIKSIQHGPVIYSDKEYNIGTGEPGVGDPFVKRTSYKSQMEYRFVLHPKSEICTKGILVNCAALCNMLSPHHFDAADAPDPTGQPLSADECTRLLPQILSIWDSLDSSDSLAKEDFDKKHRATLLRCLYEAEKIKPNASLVKYIARDSATFALIMAYRMPTRNW